MKLSPPKQRLLIAALGLFSIAQVERTDAAVVYSFATSGDTEGFVSNGPAVVTQNAFAGGSLSVAGAPGGGDFFESDSRAASVSYSAASALSDEFLAAYANATASSSGGTITFDVTIFGDDINWAGAGRPGVLEFQTTLEGIGRDTEVALLSVPDPGDSVSRSVTIDIYQGSGNQFNGTNGNINFDNSASGALHFGFKDGGDFINDATFYLDNVTITAIPEPSGVALVALAGFALIARRR